MTHKKSTSWGSISFFSVLVSTLATILVYRVDSLPVLEWRQLHPATHFISNGHLLRGAEYLGVGKLQGPEDVAYDKKSGVIYTGCGDGWIKQVHIRKSMNSKPVVENWVNTGGRPLGLVLGLNNELIVADAFKGLLNVTKDGVELLTDEAEGKKFNFTNGVDVACDGKIYFTDSSYKFGIRDVTLALMDPKPRGRFMSFDPATKLTKVLVRDLYFANGVAVSPDQNHVVFCETIKKRCSKYRIKGEKMGCVEDFIDNLPARPDNIRYDRQGHYWIALVDAMANTSFLGRRGGVFETNLEGKPIAHYYDFNLSLTVCNKFGYDLYCASIFFPYMFKFNLTKHPPPLP